MAGLSALGQVSSKLYLIWQVPPVCAWVSWDEIDPLLLQGIYRLGDVVCQGGGLLAEVALEVGPWLSLIGDGKLIVARGDGGQVRD